MPSGFNTHYNLSGEPEDTERLLFLAAFLRSKLARYFVLHTANLGTERDKVHMSEVFRLLFFLPDDEVARPMCRPSCPRLPPRVEG